MSLASIRRDGRVATVTLERPEALNAISGRLADDLRDAFREVAGDDGVWVVILAAAGDKAFCVGADLKERSTFSDDEWSSNRHHIHDLFDALRAVPQPTIASVFGYALGGGFELALSCDLIVASDDARLGLTEVRVGIIPGGGGTAMLPRKAGLSRAKELIFTGRQVTAEEARAMGVVARVVPRAELAGATHALAEEIAANAPLAVRRAKYAIDEGHDAPIDDAIRIEDAAWRAAVASKDRAEGIAAFIEKRTPNWSGE
jgi:enoyl-CoA hydratase/carnithine racemase